MYVGCRKACVASLLLGCAILTIAGCGVQDYETRVDRLRDRLRRFDEREKSLGLPLHPPMVVVAKDEPPQPAFFPFFLRPPMGFKRKPVDDFSFNNVTLFRYPGTRGQMNLFVAGSKVGEKSKKGLFEPGELSQSEFRRRVRGALTEYYRKTFKTSIQFPDTEKPGTETLQPIPDPDPMPPVEVETLRFEDRPGTKFPFEFLLYFHRKGIFQIAVVFQIPKANVEAEMQYVTYSLKSLELDAGQIQQRRAKMGRYYSDL